MHSNDAGASTLAARTSVIVPTLNAEPYMRGLLQALAQLPEKPRRVLFIDSHSTDETVALALAAGHDVHVIKRGTFGHGRTRNVGARMCADSEFLVYLTQDARPQGDQWLARLLAPMVDPQVAVVYGRQLPREGATPSERYAREFNYPPRDERSELPDLPRRGIKAVFCSNSFAAYRRDALMSAGGFPELLPMGEDMAVVLRLLQHGHARVYQSTACAIHSHDYRIAEEFRRYFDIGVLMAMDAELQRVRLAASGEGLRFLKGELAATFRAGRPLAAIGVLLRTAAKFTGFFLGQRYAMLPSAMCRRMSMHRHFWSS